MTKFTAVLLLAVTLAVIEQCTALQCYGCDVACEVSKATKTECGKNIGATHEAVCTTQVPKDKSGTKEAIRKCLIVNKGEKSACPDGLECKDCKSDLCNAAPSMGTSAAIVGVITAFCVAKFLY